MNLKKGMNRLAFLLGVIGIVAGMFIYFDSVPKDDFDVLVMIFTGLCFGVGNFLLTKVVYWVMSSFKNKDSEK